MTNSIEEVAHNDVLFIIGSNTTEAHPIIGNKMKQAAKNGGKLIVIDPRKTEIAEFAHIHVPLKSGTDAALVNGLMHIIIKEDLHDKEFIAERVVDFEEVAEVVEKYTPEYTSRITEVPVDTLYEVARLYATTKKAGIFYTLGITEHTTGTANVMNLANLAMLTGHLGTECSGVNPLRGQNNVQGACDMAALPNYFPGYKQAFDPFVIEEYEERWGVELNTNPGLRIPEMLDSAYANDGIKAMIVMGEDPVLTDPDANHVRKALENLEFFVSQNIIMSESSKLADVVLPAACYAEKDGTFTNTERRVQRVRKAADAPGEARLDWEILCDIAKGMGAPGFDYKSAEDIFEEIRECIGSYHGITYDRIDKVGLQWPCPDTDHPGTKFLHKGTFAIGKGIMIPVEYEEPAELCDEEYPILLNTGRMLYHYNVMTRESSALNGIRPYELAQINPRDAKKYGLDENSYIRVTSRRGSIVTRIEVTERVKEGMMFMTFHYKESPVNDLTNAESDPITKTAEYKISAVKIEKVDSEEEALQAMYDSYIHEEYAEDYEKIFHS